MAGLASLMASLTDTTPKELLKVKPLTRVRVRRVMAYNGDTVDHRVQIGYNPVNPDGTVSTAGFTQILPDIVVPARQTVVVEVPPAAVSSTDKALNALTAKLEGTAASPVLVIAEVEEA